MDLISLIIPVFKVEMYLDLCIRSVVDQTYRNLEIILVDDGSPDRCPQICDMWREKDSRVQVIHKSNGGLSDARNAGMAAARGEYIAFIDSDDIIEPEYIEYLYDAIQETGTLVSECRHRRFSDNSKLTPFPKEKTKPVLQSQEEALQIFCNHYKEKNHNVWDKLYHRCLLENETFAVGYRAQDVLFCCHIFTKVRKIAIVEQALYNYRIRPGSASDGFIVQRLHAFEMYLRSIKHLTANYPVSAKELKIYYCSLCNGAVEWLENTVNRTDKDTTFKQIVSFRRKIRFSRDELRMCSFSDLLIVAASSPMLIRPYIIIRRLMERIAFSNL